MRKEKNRLYNEEGEIVQKMCSKCSEWKPLSEYYKHKSNKIDGHNPKCKECLKLYYIENKEERGKYSKQYYKKNGEWILDYSKQYYIENKEEILEYSKQYYIENKEEILERKKNDKE